MALETRLLRQVLRAHLIADTDVKALADTRIFGSHLSDADVQTVLYPLVVIQFLSGFARWHRGVQSQSFELYAYSKADQDEASELYDTVFNSYQQSRVELAGIPNVCGICRETQRPVDGWNDKIGAWFARGRWVVNATG